MAIQIDARTSCDLELIVSGAFFPLSQFMNQSEYSTVVHDWKLPNGHLFPLPVVLRISDDEFRQCKSHSFITLCKEDREVARMGPCEFFEVDLDQECDLVYGTRDAQHPYVQYLYQSKRRWCVSGPIKCGIILDDRLGCYLKPSQTREFFAQNQWRHIVGFQTRNPMHRAHFELTLRALQHLPDMKLLLHPILQGVTQEQDQEFIPDHSRLCCYHALLAEYPDPKSVLLAGLPLSMRMAGPREAVFHAVIRANFGCTHFIVGRDHAGPSTRTSTGHTFYSPTAAQEAVQYFKNHLEKIGIQVLCMDTMVYVPSKNAYLTALESESDPTSSLSGTELRALMKNHQPVPEWFSFPLVARILSKPKGICFYIVGLSCSGKTTLGRELMHHFERSGRTVTFLDGDNMRQLLQDRLGYSRSDRQCNTRLMGYVASEVVRHGGVCVVCNIAPYRSDRIHNRNLIGLFGRYIQVFVNTPLDVCRQRDSRGIYQRTHVTGVDDPFEVPTESDLVVSGNASVTLNMEKIIEYSST